MAICQYFIKKTEKVFSSLILFTVKTRFTHQFAVASSNPPKYPPIIDTSEEGILKHKRMVWYDSLKSLPTVEQKLYEIIINRQFSKPVYTVGSCMSRFSAIPYQYYITRTHFIHEVPEKLMTINVDEELSCLKETFNKTLAMHYFNHWGADKTKHLSDHLAEKRCGSELVNKLLTDCCRKLVSENDYLLQSIYQENPDISSFWYHGNFKTKGRCVHERNLIFQFTDIPVCAIRMKKPLPSILPLNDGLCASNEVVDYNYRPSVLSIETKKYHYPKFAPGFWLGDSCEFPLLQVYSADRMSKLISEIDHYDIQDIEDGLGVMASFGWLNGIAHYQGFTSFHDVTYPIVCHTILTNGQDWTFYTYQLNTICFHEDVDMKDRRNICWSSGKMRLFEDIQDGQIKGINDEVFAMLLKVFLYAPETNSDIQLKPYLGMDTRSEEEIVTMRKDLHKKVKNFKTHYLYQNEVPLWQKIYKFHKDAPPSPTIKME